MKFCQLLGDPDNFIWFERVFIYYLESGDGEKLDRIRHAVRATEELATFLDKCVTGEAAIIPQLTGGIVLAYP